MSSLQLYKHIDCIEYHLSMKSQVDQLMNNIECRNTARLKTEYAIDSYNVSTGVYMSLEMRFREDNKDQTYSFYELQIGHNDVYKKIEDTSFCKDMDSRIMFGGVNIYLNENSSWEVHIDTLDWYINQQLAFHTEKLTFINHLLSPSSLPLLGIPPELSIESGSTDEIVIRPGIDREHDIQIASTCEGGWRYKIDNVWHSPSMQLLPDVEIFSDSIYRTQIESHYLSSCHISDPIRDVFDQDPNGKKSIDPIIVQKKNIYKKFSKLKKSVVLLPETKKNILKNNSKYGVIIERDFIPGTFYSSSMNSVGKYFFRSSVWEKYLDDDTKHDTMLQEIHSDIDQQTKMVGEKEDEIEHPLRAVSFAPVSIQHHSWELNDVIWNVEKEGFFSFEKISFDKPEHSKDVQESVDYVLKNEKWYKAAYNDKKFPVIDSDTREKYSRLGSPSLDHINDHFLYFNTVVNPFWSFFYSSDENNNLDSNVLYFPVMNTDSKHNNESTCLVHSSVPADKRLKSKIYAGYKRKNTFWWGHQKKNHTEYIFKEKYILKNRNCWNINYGDIYIDGKIEIKPVRKDFSIAYNVVKDSGYDEIIEIFRNINISYQSDIISDINVKVLFSNGIENEISFVDKNNNLKSINIDLQKKSEIDMVYIMKAISQDSNQLKKRLFNVDEKNRIKSIEFNIKLKKLLPFSIDIPWVETRRPEFVLRGEASQYLILFENGVIYRLCKENLITSPDLCSLLNFPSSIYDQCSMLDGNQDVVASVGKYHWYLDEKANIYVLPESKRIPSIASCPDYENNIYGITLHDDSTKGVFIIQNSDNKYSLKNLEQLTFSKNWCIHHVPKNLSIESCIEIIQNGSLQRYHECCYSILLLQFKVVPKLSLKKTVDWYGLAKLSVISQNEQLSCYIRTKNSSHLLYSLLEKEPLQLDVLHSIGCYHLLGIQNSYEYELYEFRKVLNKTLNIYKGMKNNEIVKYCKLPDENIFMVKIAYLKDRSEIEIDQKMIKLHSRSIKDIGVEYLKYNFEPETIGQHFELLWSQYNPYGIVLLHMNKNNKQILWNSKNHGRNWKVISEQI